MGKLAFFNRALGEGPCGRKVDGLDLLRQQLPGAGENLVGRQGFLEKAAGDADGQRPAAAVDLGR